MDARLSKIVKGVQGHVQENPGGDVDPGTLLQLEVLRSGFKDTFSEDDMIDAAEAVGVSKDDVLSWLEDFASYL